ncbi:MAG: hypothetical protein NT038_03015 [Euryarchaeota archaeon]|nr:hypothetical protein [Euryarchaeota archaeon]
METNKKNLLLILGNSLAVIATIVVNALAVILPLNGKSTNELSDAIPNLFVPAGITFSIWGIIYILIIIFMLYQILQLRKKEQKNMVAIEKIGGWFILASLGNILWIFLWHYQYVTLSVGAMLILFSSLLRIYLKLNIGLSTVQLKEKIAVHITISVYLGWITVATIANVTAVLVNLNVGELFLGQANWTTLVIAVAILITIIMLLRRKDVAYSLVIIWALLGIFIKRINPDPIFGTQTNIAITAAIAILIIFIVMLIKIMSTMIKKRTAT